jgi:hypothetical protein
LVVVVLLTVVLAFASGSSAGMSSALTQPTAQVRRLFRRSPLSQVPAVVYIQSVSLYLLLSHCTITVAGVQVRCVAYL